MSKGKTLEEVMDRETFALEKPFKKNYNNNNFNSRNNQQNQTSKYQNNRQFNNSFNSNQQKNNSQVKNNQNYKKNYQQNYRNNFNSRNIQTRNYQNNSKPIQQRNFKSNWKKRTNLIENDDMSESENDQKETNVLISADSGILRSQFKLNNVTSTVVLDTGSSISLINSNFAKKFDAKVEKNFTQIKTANDTQLDVFGKTKLTLEIDKKKFTHEFLLSHFKYPVLIGMDFLEIHNFMINLQDKTLLQSTKLVSNLINVISLDKLISNYSSIFNDNPSSPALLEPMKINLNSDKCKVVNYRTSQTEDSVISEEVKKMLHLNIIRKSKSNFTFPVLLVKKKIMLFASVLILEN